MQDVGHSALGLGTKEWQFLESLVAWCNEPAGTLTNRDMLGMALSWKRVEALAKRDDWPGIVSILMNVEGRSRRSVKPS